MEFSDARKELDCSICLNIYTNPVTLRCGHSFCRECIEDVRDTQGESGVNYCPECREEFQERPELSRNTTLRNIMERFQSTEPEKKKRKILCTYCIHSPVPAVKFCLHCEASLCDDHLRIHSKSSQHVLSDLTTPQKNKKCSMHEKILEYYCTEDSVCLCESCRLHGDHQEHQVEALEEASEKRKENLTNALQKLVKKREEIEESIKSLQKYKRKVQDSADGVTKRVTTIFRDIRRKLNILERRVLKEITMKAEKVSFPASDLIQDLEIKKDELSRKIRHIEEICNMTDPLAFLQESDTGETVAQYRDVISPQVMSSQSFSSGRHYWDVDVGGSSHWRVGMCYPSIARTGNMSEIGYNEKSWCLERKGDTFLVKHNQQSTNIMANIPIHRVRVFLDYKAGRLAFYELDILIRHLHTFTDIFTEPLHAALYVGGGYIKLGGWERGM
ncbi:E3 ubiquitin/ISG15 ligase TRIM25-like isoform X2 [Aquarana catesbeiana]|uniref:E3 ubiquitin/ISG15 ligase TRIM25-like isoform X2 n=1 Tax=Aquarana catesbeiana TaxID=8400 RepID=UPI003CCA3CBA